MFVLGGPSALCRFNRNARSLTFKMITPSVSVTSEQFHREKGLEVGEQISTLSPFHRLVWEDDKLKVIENEFINMCNRIEKANSS